MPQVTPNCVARVDLAEYERGWGSKIFERVYFTTLEEAVQFIKEYNAQNVETAAPDYYTVAQGPYNI